MGQNTRNFILGLLLFLLLPGVAVAQEKPFVCLDPGHGGNTGAHNEENNLWEDAVNLDIANRLKDQLVERDFSVVLTRTDNTNKSREERHTTCEQAGASLLISLHADSSINPDEDGLVVFYVSNEDKQLAKAIHDSIFPRLRDDPDITWPFSDFGIVEAETDILPKTDIPSVEIHVANIDNNNIAQLLLATGEDSRRQLTAEAITAGVEFFLTQITPGQTPPGEEQTPQQNQPGENPNGNILGRADRPTLLPSVNAGQFITGLISLIIVVAFIAAFLYFLWGGMQWLTSGGEDAAVKAARGRILQALIGLAIVVTSWAIFQLIQVAFGITILGGPLSELFNSVMPR